MNDIAMEYASRVGAAGVNVAMALAMVKVLIEQGALDPTQYAVEQLLKDLERANDNLNNPITR